MQKAPTAIGGKGSCIDRADDGGLDSRNHATGQRPGRVAWILRAEVERAAMFAVICPRRAHAEPSIEVDPHLAGKRPFPSEEAARRAMAAIGAVRIRRAS